MCMAAALYGAYASAQQQFPPVPLVAVRPIEPPPRPLPPEEASIGQTKFSFLAYGDTRGPIDGQGLQPNHAAVVDSMVQRISSLEATEFPVRFVLHTGDAVASGTNGAAWNVSYNPLIERITKAGVPYFFAPGNHDVAVSGEGSRALGLHNALSAMAKLIPPEGSLRRLSGYPTYAFGYGNFFGIAIDSNVAEDPLQLAWVTDQIRRLDRTRYRHIVLFFHHPMFSSGPHGGASGDPTPPAADAPDNVEKQTAAIRELYGPLCRSFHVRLTIAGHDHLFDHWVERYIDAGRAYRRDDFVTGGGGAPTYLYRGEPDVHRYLASGAAQSVRLEHLMRPGNSAAENPHHYIVVQVDGDRLSVEVVGTGPDVYKPYGGTASRMELNDPG